MFTVKSLKTYGVLWVILIVFVLYISYMRNSSMTEKPEVDDEALLVASDEQGVTLSDDELNGMWVPYMDLFTSEGTQESFETNFISIVETADDLGINALFVHVRPFSDALYNSEIYPWSHIITGTQGKDPEFDPMQFMINVCHENDMEFHAWINPLRVKLTQTPPNLSDDNPYTLLGETHPFYFIETASGIFLNPAYKEVRNIITDGVAEIVENYDVDGIHFDDYFYPYDMGEEDLLAYQTYTENTDSPLDINDWRKSNINTLVSNVYREIKNIDSSVVFGISPQANFNNNNLLAADVLTWCKVYGYIDYICPQIYFSYDNPSLGFTESLDAWLNVEKHEGLDLYIGLGLYKENTEEDGGTWLGTADTIAKQIADVAGSEADGFIIYDSVAAQREDLSTQMILIKEAIDENY